MEERKEISRWFVFLLVILPALFGTFAFGGTVFILVGWNPYVGGFAGMIIWFITMFTVAAQRMERR